MRNPTKLYGDVFEALHEAKRFIRIAENYQKRMKREEGNEWAPCHTKEAGAVRRSSLDLSRVLAELRKY